MITSMRECWMLKEDRRKSATKKDWTNKPTWHVLVLEYVKVPLQDRRKGLFKSLIQDLCSRLEYDFIVVEGVQNPILVDALKRWGWKYDEQVMDFYSPMIKE